MPACRALGWMRLDVLGMTSLAAAGFSSAYKQHICSRGPAVQCNTAPKCLQQLWTQALSSKCSS